MKNGGLLLIACTLILATGCRKDDSDVERIVIKGKITSGTKHGDKLEPVLAPVYPPNRYKSL